MTDRSKVFIGDAMARLVVVQAEGPLGMRDLEVTVGAMPYARYSNWYVSIAVKLALEAKPGEELWSPAAKRAPLFADVPSRFTNDLTILDHANDFVPFKDDTDVLVVGHARPDAPAKEVRATLRIMSAYGPEDEPLPTHLSAAVLARVGADAPKIPLSAPYLVGGWGGSVTRLAPTPDARRLIGGYLDPRLERSVFQSATAEMRIKGTQLRGDEIIATSGLLEPGLGVPPTRATGSPGVAVREQVMGLPGIYPVVTADVHDVEGQSVWTYLDTIHLDTDVARLCLTWRGSIGPVTNPDQISRLVVSMERRGLERSSSDRLADTQRGCVRFAWLEDDAKAGKLPPSEHPVLDHHRYLTWGEVAPEPRVLIRDYARISAELCEWPTRREDTLKRHGHTEESWLLEERCWIERFGADAASGKAELPAYFGTLFVEEQDKLSSPEEDQLGVHDFAWLLHAVDNGADVAEVLAKAEITLPVWLRLQRKWEARADADPSVAQEIEAIYTSLGGEEDLPDPGELDDDDDDDDEADE
jgi:hypothetical protein